jgi:hypothetical protein
VLDRAFGKTRPPIPDPHTFADGLRQCVPDAADYDAVISGSHRAWRATTPLIVDRMWADEKCRLRWDEPAPAEQRGAPLHAMRPARRARASDGVAPFVRGATQAPGAAVDADEIARGTV